MKDIDRLMRFYINSEAIIYSYGISPSNVSAELADNLIDMGTSNDGKLVCNKCYCIFSGGSKNKKCQKCNDKKLLKSVKKLDDSIEKKEEESSQEKIEKIQVAAFSSFYRQILKQVNDPIHAFIRAIEMTSDDSLKKINSKQYKMLQDAIAR